MDGDAAALERELRALKRRGAHILLLDGPAETAACDRLLGDEDRTRRHLFVSTSGCRVDRAGERTRDRDPRRFGFVDVGGGGTRSAVEPSSLDPGEVPRPPEPVEPIGPVAGARDRRAAEWYSRTAPTDGLPEIARHVHVHLSRFEAEAPSPGEIRVCFDSLDPYVEGVDPAYLRRFLRVVTARTRSASAMAHYHLSKTADDRVRETLPPLFDATVETRVAADGPRQRWTLREPGLRTNWLPLE
ncbi:DUF7504 family protein [Halegenticoccus soli]|uniref:DUF7504 family protein n=1 Tax=Halegenticoccus soli TaxID=1985678 RepID=UPI000C6D4158|nr:hypothetical protein [Halegenticoccus soli]